MDPTPATLPPHEPLNAAADTAPRHRPSTSEADPHRVSTDTDAGTGFRLSIAAVLVVGVLAGLFAFGYLQRRHEAKGLAAEADKESAAPPTVDVVEVYRAKADELMSLPGTRVRSTRRPSTPEPVATSNSGSTTLVTA